MHIIRYIIRNFLSILLETVKVTVMLFIALVIALTLRAYVFEWTKVSGSSMEDTLYDRQVLLSYRLGYEFSEPKRGDIIIFIYKKGEYKLFKFINKSEFFKKIVPNSSDVNYIKRVVGVPGDTVFIDYDGYLYINGKKMEESYAKGRTYGYSIQYPLTVPKGKVFVLGDNREFSKDSREIGLVDSKQIKGRAVFRLAPLSELGTIH